MFYPRNLTRSNENMTIRSPIPTITVFTTDARQPWTDLRGCYSGYLTIYFNYLILSCDYLTAGYNEKISMCSVHHFYTRKAFCHLNVFTSDRNSLEIPYFELLTYVNI